MKIRIVVKWTSIQKEEIKGTVTMDRWREGNIHLGLPDHTSNFNVTVSHGSYSLTGAPADLHHENMGAMVETPLGENLKTMCMAYFDGLNQKPEIFLWELP